MNTKPSNAVQVEKVMANAVAVIMEHCNTVQILATVHERGQTYRIMNGAGNWYARVGMCKEFVDKDKAQSEHQVFNGSGS